MQSINVSTDGPVAGLGWISGPGRRKASDLQFFFFIFFYISISQDVVSGFLIIS